LTQELAWCDGSQSMDRRHHKETWKTPRWKRRIETGNTNRAPARAVQAGDPGCGQQKDRVGASVSLAVARQGLCWGGVTAQGGGERPHVQLRQDLVTCTAPHRVRGCAGKPVWQAACSCQAWGSSPSPPGQVQAACPWLGRAQAASSLQSSTDFLLPDPTTEIPEASGGDEWDLWAERGQAAGWAGGQVPRQLCWRWLCLRTRSLLALQG